MRKVSEILTLAKPYLHWDVSYICTAVSTLRFLGHISHDEYNQTVDFIRTSIKHHVYLINYLKDIGYIPYTMTVRSPEYPAIRDAWLDARITELQARGE